MLIIDTTTTKYFKELDNVTIQCQVIDRNGTVAPLPKKWANQYVNVKYLKDNYEQKYVYVKYYGNATCINVPKMYLGTKLLASLASS